MSRNVKTIGRVARGAAAAYTLAWAAAAGAQTAATNNVWFTGGLLNERVETVGTTAVLGTAGPVDLLSLPVGEAAFGQADGATNTLRAMGASKGFSGSNEPSVQAWSTGQKTVLGTGPGVPVGTPVVVTLGFAVSGELQAGAFEALNGQRGNAVPGSAAYGSLAGANLTLRVWDLDAPGRGPRNPNMEFRYLANVGVTTDPVFGTGSVTHLTAREDARLSTDAGTQFWAGGYSRDTPLAGSVFERSAIVTTLGPQTVSFDAVVGHRLAFEYFLTVDTFGFGGPVMHAGVADLSHTFDAEWSANLAGVAFSNDLPGVAPLPAVPEPAMAALWLLGLAAVAVRRLGADRQPRGCRADRA